MPRVLHVIPSFAGGGAERQVALLAAALVRSGVEVHIAHLHDGPNLELAQRSGAVLHKLGIRRNHDPRTLTRLIALIRRLRPTVVQTWLLHSDAFGGVAARLCGVPWVLSERCSAAMYEHGLKFRLRRALGRSASAIVANSESGLAYWRASGFRGPGAVIRNIVALPDAPAARAEQGGAAGGALILGVGRLNEQKNWPTLLQALERVFAQRPDARAVVLGEGPLQNVLQAQIETSAALRGRVSLPGYAADVAAWYRRANVLVSLSHFEGTPNTVFEAMAALCPVVVSDIPEHREIAGPDSALLVPRASAPAAAAAILDVLADPGAAHRRAQRARQNIERWGADAVAAAYLEVYRSCARPRAQPAHE